MGTVILEVGAVIAREEEVRFLIRTTKVGEGRELFRRDELRLKSICLL